MIRRLICACTTAALASCAGPTPYNLQTPYNDADFAPWGVPGSATLRGQAFLKTVGGDVKTCAGNDVFLMPANAYNTEAVNASGAIANRDPRSLAFLHKTTCDAEGRFVFTGLAPLKWFVLTDVTWGVPDGYSIAQQGGEVAKEIQLAAGGDSIILTGNDLK